MFIAVLGVQSYPSHYLRALKRLIEELVVNRKFGQIGSVDAAIRLSNSICLTSKRNLNHDEVISQLDSCTANPIMGSCVRCG